MDDTEATSLEQIRAFLAGSGEVRSAGQRREEVYGCQYSPDGLRLAFHSESLGRR